MPTRVRSHLTKGRRCKGRRTIHPENPCSKGQVRPGTQQLPSSRSKAVNFSEKVERTMALSSASAIDQQALTRVWEEVDTVGRGGTYTVKLQYYQTTPDHAYSNASHQTTPGHAYSDTSHQTTPDHAYFNAPLQTTPDHVYSDAPPDQQRPALPNDVFKPYPNDTQLHKTFSEAGQRERIISSIDSSSKQNNRGRFGGNTNCIIRSTYHESRGKLQGLAVDKRRCLNERQKRNFALQNHAHKEVFPNLSKCSAKINESCLYKTKTESLNKCVWTNESLLTSLPPSESIENRTRQQNQDHYEHFQGPLQVSPINRDEQLNEQNIMALQNKGYDQHQIQQPDDQFSRLPQQEPPRYNQQYNQEFLRAGDTSATQIEHRGNYDSHQSILEYETPFRRNCLLPKNFTPVHLRSLEETEAAHDLLQLAQSAPAFPNAVSLVLSPSYEVAYDSEPTTPAPSPTGSSDAENVAPLDSLEDGRARIKSELTGCPRYTCSECGKQYATSSNLSRHKQTHRTLDSGNARRCHVCGKAYVSMPALAMHVLTHNLNHKCGVCGKAFSRPWLLQGHMRSHTGEKPFGCAHCGKSFADRSNLRAHMQTHSQLKNFKCKRCNKSFALKSYLNKHHESACYREGSCADTADAST